MLSWAVLIGLATGAQPGAKESPAELAAWIDAKLEANWRAKNLPVREVASDEVFLRRAYLELTGSIPSVAEARDFLESTSASKREQLIRTLLDDKRYAEHTARQWARTLAPAGNTKVASASNVYYQPGYAADARAIAGSLSPQPSVLPMPTPAPVKDLVGAKILVVVAADLAK